MKNQIIFIVSGLFLLIALQNQFFIHTDDSSITSNYGITEPAIELPNERTLRTATFDLGNGKRAQVSVSPDLFTHNPNQKDSIILANSKGVEKDGKFVFDYLPQDTQVSFDLKKPSYNLRKGEHSFTFSFVVNSSIQGTILNDHQISYPLSDTATLVWTVDEMNVKKEIHVKNTGTNPTFEFSINSTLAKSLENNSIILSDGSKQIFKTEKPYLLTANRSPLLASVSLMQNLNGNYEYAYDEANLPEEYILDPDTGVTYPGTATQTNSETLSWSNVNGVKALDPLGSIYASLEISEANAFATVNSILVSNFSFRVMIR